MGRGPNMSRHWNGRLSWIRLALLLLLLVVAVGAGWWAGRSTLAPSASGPSEYGSELAVAVRQASVGQSLALSVTVTQPFRPVSSALLPGVITETPDLGTVSSGDILYRVDNVPVRAVTGDTPFYRKLTTGVRGPDVTEVQTTLIDLGYLSGKASGTFDEATVSAARRWQAELGQQPSGTIALGELVALPELPAVVRRGESVILGASLAGGEPTVLARTGNATFQLIVSAQQAELIPGDATVSMRWEQSTWKAVISDVTNEVDSSRVVMNLASPNGGLPCGTECDQLPSDEKISLRSTVEIVPQTTGPAVPAAAVHTAADGSSYVRMSDGTQQSVTIKASANGLVVVDGLTDGDQVLALGGNGNGNGRSSTPSGPPTGGTPEQGPGHRDVGPAPPTGAGDGSAIPPGPPTGTTTGG